MKKDAKLTVLKNRKDHQCFACSPVNPFGLKMKFFADEKAIFSWLTVPSHFCGWDNVVHGGVLSTILDETMGRTAIYFLKTYAFTHSMTTEFIKYVHTGEEIRAEGRVLETMGQREVLVEGLLYKGDNLLCAKSTGLFKLLSAGAISKLGLMEKESIGKYDFLINQ